MRRTASRSLAAALLLVLAVLAAGSLALVCGPALYGVPEAVALLGWASLLLAPLALFAVLMLLWPQPRHARPVRPRPLHRAVAALSAGPLLAEDARMLVVALSSRDETLQHEAARVLLRMAPALTPGDPHLAPCWPAIESGLRQRYSPMSPQFNGDLVLAFLAVVEHAGGSCFLPAVRAIAAADLRKAVPCQILAAARRCLEVLEVRADAERARDRLLRPSVPPVVPEVLLRPAGAPTAPAEGLLRPARISDQEASHAVRAGSSAASPL